MVPLYLSAHGISVLFWLLQGIKSKAQLSIPSFKISIYSKKESFACRKSHALLLLLTSEIFADAKTCDCLEDSRLLAFGVL